ncbi:MAG: penicillin-binding protein 1B, partial [Nitrospirae bacterium]
LYLDLLVKSKFNGKRWELPTRVYARPLELYPGKKIEPYLIEKELKRLGYISSSVVAKSGTFLRKGDRFYIFTRKFTFWDGEEPAKRVRLLIRNGEVLSIKDLSRGKRYLSIIRLDPILIGSFYPKTNEDRILIKLKDTPKLLIYALISIEDKNYYKHHGIDPKALIRALLANIRAGATVQGGSTITQQLVKNFYLSSERTLWRKLNEAIMAILLELHYSKDEILETYINEVFLGQQGRYAVHGFALASEFYFGRPLNELKLHHFALLAGIVKGPSYYNPKRHPKRALKRRNQVIDAMVRNGYITAEEAEAAKKRKLGVVKHAGLHTRFYPAFMDLVRRQLREDYKESDITTEGLKVFSTLSPYVQEMVEKGVQKGLSSLERRRGLKRGTLQCAVVVTNPKNGDVLAIIGGRNSSMYGFNRALDAVRQIGSLIKPAVYLTAIEEGYTLITPIRDYPISLRQKNGSIWRPKNYDHTYHGVVPLHVALSHSYNLATVRLGLKIGLKDVLITLKKLGVKRKIDKYPSMLLGAVSMTPFEVTQMYQSIASGGFYTPLRAIRAVVTSDGLPLKRYGISVKKVFSSESIFLLNTMLKEVVKEGTGRPLRYLLNRDIEVAGKTGTTNDLRDSWFAGFTNEYLSVVWVGRDDNKPCGLTGSSGALRIWADIMNLLRPSSIVLIKPTGIEYVLIDPVSNLRANSYCENAVAFPFIKGTAPIKMASCEKRYFYIKNKEKKKRRKGILQWLRDLF